MPDFSPELRFRKTWLHAASLTTIALSTNVLVANAQTAAPADTTIAPSGATASSGTATTSAVTPQVAATPEPLKIGSYTVTGSYRARVEHWNWFDAPPFDDRYTYLGSLLRVGIGRQQPRTDVQIELGIPTVLGLPKNALAPPPQGQLGLGASYYAANGGQDASIFPHQAFVRFKKLGGNQANTLRLGRFEFWDGAEVTPKEPSLSWLKRERVSSRLIGNFGFTHVQRSLDGLQFMQNQAKGNFTFVAARPTEGVFQLNGLGEVKDIEVAYGAFTKPLRRAEARVFGIYYHDGRQAPLATKVDNRPLSARTTDTDDISITTLGAHYITTFNAGKGVGDFVAWGALQTGNWGTLDHRANALALEAGFQPGNSKLKPWLRAGYYRSSGDGNSADGRHGTFFQILPTPRAYARFPFYNSMNNEDLFVQTLLRPSPRLTLRGEAHRVRLSNANDLWYSGGGAFQDNSFGFAGRPSGGSRNLANVFDLGADYALSPRLSFSAYLGHASGKGAVSTTYPAGDSGQFAYVELTQRF